MRKSSSLKISGPVRWLSSCAGSLLLFSCHSVPPAKVESNAVRVREEDHIVAIENDRVRVAYNLLTGRYQAVDKCTNRIGVDSAYAQVNQWASTAVGCRHTWLRTARHDELGTGQTLRIAASKPGQPTLLLDIALYAGQPFFTLSAGLENTTTDTLQVRDLQPLAGGLAFGGLDCRENFGLLDGYGGGEATFVRKQAPLRSRNNLLLTFGSPQRHQSLVMGGLTYRDFEKFATVQPAHPRFEALQRQAGSARKLLAYLDLGPEKESFHPDGPALRLATGAPHPPLEQAPDPATASAVYDQEKVTLTLSGLAPNKDYSVGFSWAADANARVQSVQAAPGHRPLPVGQAPVTLLAARALPSLAAGQRPQEIQLNLPKATYPNGQTTLIFKRGTGPNVLLSEAWLAEGKVAAAQAGRPTPVPAAAPSFRRLHLQLAATDPVGKRVDPGQRYFAENDRFYVDFSEDNPFLALEAYGQRLKQAQRVQLSTYDFPTVCLWYAMHWNYGNGPAVNDSPGSVAEMDRIANSGFLRYAPAAVRLVPDCYDANNEQGWWDDAHWQRHGSGSGSGANDIKVKRHYQAPYETSEKWGRAITRRGGVPITYFQTGKRSQNYAEAFPQHMLFNQANAPIPDYEWTVQGKASYDFTDPGFREHLREVYANLRRGGVRGIMFDYPNTGWAAWGGMQDRYSTTAAAYRTIYQLASDGLGTPNYLDERNLDRGADLTLGLVASQRTWGDTDDVTPEMVTRSGLRWYKNRVVVNYDMDAKNLLKAQPANPDGRRKLLTMAYVASGRLLLANSFAKLTPAVLHDLSRLYPFHAQPQSARPVDAFLSKYPQVYDFPVDAGWHQLTFYNPNNHQPARIGVDFAGSMGFGGLGLDAGQSYYVYDFWNNQLLGKFPGQQRFTQQLRPGEARMMSVRAVQAHPQVLATDRHLMQGYVELTDVQWNADKNQLSGTLKTVAREPLRIMLAPNGYQATGCAAPGARAAVAPPEPRTGVIQLEIETPQNDTVRWTVNFKR